jgi:hypothetical protein
VFGAETGHPDIDPDAGTPERFRGCRQPVVCSLPVAQPHPTIFSPPQKERFTHRFLLICVGLSVYLFSDERSTFDV